jgi:predicted anti-sigma-YlaC factor YlaD
MEDCDKLDLLWLEGRYLGFIAETSTELNILEHLKRCGACRSKVMKAIENDEKILGLGSLFQKSSCEEKVPNFEGDTESFVDARITWRKRKLEDLLRSAELELEDLRRGLG